MTILKDVLAELLSMFLGDLRLSIATLAVVALAALLIHGIDLDPLLGGTVLLVGCLGVVLCAVWLAARPKD